MEEPSFWDDPKEAAKTTSLLKSLQSEVEAFNKLKSDKDDIETLIEMGYEDEDAAMVDEIKTALDEFITSFEDLKIKTLLSGEYDGNNAILKLNAGAGGTEACDWCSMLYRMYLRWASSKGFTVEELDSLTEMRRE